MHKRPFDRGDRIATEIRHAVAEVCRDRLDSVRFEHLEITHVRMTKDLRMAYVYFFIRTSPALPEECLTAMEAIKGWMKQAIGERISLKYMPDLRFFFDESIEQGEHVHEIFRQLDVKPETTEEDPS